MFLDLMNFLKFLHFSKNVFQSALDPPVAGGRATVGIRNHIWSLFWITINAVTVALSGLAG